MNFRMRSHSFTFSLFLRLLQVLALAAAFPWFMAYWLDHGWQMAAISVLVLLAAMWFSLTRADALAVSCASRHHQQLPR